MSWNLNMKFEKFRCDEKDERPKKKHTHNLLDKNFNTQSDAVT